jgi:hypothetical protein
MLDQSKVVVNNVGKGQIDNLLKAHDKVQPFADIQIPVFSGDQGGESGKRRILRRSVTHRDRLGTV